MDVETEPTNAAAQEVRYPRAVDREPAPGGDAGGPPVWTTRLTDWFGLIAVVWSVPLAIVIVGLPFALALAVLLWMARLA